MKPIFRVPRENELPFLVNTWVNHFRDSDACRIIPTRTYHLHFKSILRELVRSANTLVAVDPHDPDPATQLLGFVCWEMKGEVPILHYVFTKNAVRGLGIASALLSEAGLNPEEGFIYSFHCKLARQLRKRFPHCRHYPFLLLDRQPA